jgi:hypothetical protein
MIDVLAFPPDPLQLESLRVAELARSRNLEQRRRVALFVGLGLALAWAADVGAAIDARGSAHPFAFAIASVVLAIAIFAAHFAASWLGARARALRCAADRRFADVRLGDARPLLAAATSDAVVAQYLRMVGRQQRALRVVELESLMAWTRSNQTAHARTAYAEAALAGAA